MSRRIIIDGDACPVVDVIIDITHGTGISVLIIRSFSHFSHKSYPEHVEIIYVDDGPDAVDYKVVQLTRRRDIVVTQDYGLAQLVLNRAAHVLHHNGMQYHHENIDMLLAQRHHNAHIRRSGGKIKGPAPFTEQDKAAFKSVLVKLIENL